MINVYNRNFMQGMWQITKAYWFSEEKWKARALLAVIVALNLGHVYIFVLINEWNNTFYNTLQNHDKDGFVSAIGTFCILAASHIIVAVYVLYLQQFLEIKWRRWLTAEYLQTWLHKRAYYQMQLLDHHTDNPDQRISEDLKLFVNLTLGLSIGLLKAAVTLFSFMFILWNLSGSLTIPIGQTQVTIPGYMFWVAIFYSVAGNWLTVKIGKPLVDLNFSQQRYEADFRFSLIRLRENSESIALYGGEVQEQAKLTERFQMVFDNFKAVMLRQKKLTWFTSGYGQIAIIFPLVVAAPRYFSNQMQLGGLLQISGAFGKVQDSLSFLIESYSSLAQWQSVVKRLLGFNQAMNRVEHIADQKVIGVTYGADPSLHVHQLQIDLPNGEELLKDLQLTIHKGDSLLIMGPSGCGKSTLMRTLAGIWPFGQGSVRIPAEQKLLFLPQRSYLPLGTLRDSVLYPYKEDFAADEKIRSVMEHCKLEDLVDKLDQVEDWSHVLSFGEQQRIAFVRAILQQPDWLFLDEATSAIDEITEAHLYQLLHSQLNYTTIISVGHRNTLVNYHKRKLIIDDTGSWRLE
ncbi:ABC transporter ATP-binding protein/permease [Pelosinus fermentans]|uniref:Xenobiotic-transporting ATPase n=1 Tax=Pelosinus fermentans JBW45 TaxID=1192197 RepID=I8TTH8_9FIRM|nr:ABC transporter ATP-binding protein/permease [Pelosinus fermentans]AJQ29586.1 Xenobiotic-transporting ATPase [Pelosinus fermentans JBW45]